MTPTELLQQVGLNKYEAEAYYTLLVEGPLTGYELGKRSPVPLSRSYEIVERLAQQGLALVQPGEPPRYAAVEPDLFVSRLRAAQTATLDALAEALADRPRSATAGDFWVVRGRQPILERARAMIAAARHTVALRASGEAEQPLTPDLAAARTRGCRLIHPALAPAPASILLLVDGREALAGALVPADHCQAVVGIHPALVTALRGFFAQPLAADVVAPTTPATVAARNEQIDRVAWEDRKQRRLWRLAAS
jgi:hypothetical protein